MYAKIASASVYSSSGATPPAWPASAKPRHATRAPARYAVSRASSERPLRASACPKRTYTSRPGSLTDSPPSTRSRKPSSATCTPRETAGSSASYSGTADCTAAITSSTSVGTRGRSGAVTRSESDAHGRLFIRTRIRAKHVPVSSRTGHAASVRSKHDQSREVREPRRGRDPVPGARRRHRPAPGGRGRPDGPRDPRRAVPRERLRHHDRLPPHAHAPRVRLAARRQVRAGDHGPDRRAGPGDRLGGRPSQAPRVHRRGGRPALAPRPRRRLQGRAARALPRAHGLAVRDAGPGRPPPLRARPDGRPGDEADIEELPAERPARDRRRLLARPRADGDAEGRTHRAPVGRARAHFLPAPRDLEHQLGLPLLRPAQVRPRRPLDQRLLARVAVARRVVAPQPPRLPALGAPRTALVGDRRVRPDHRGDEAARPGAQRGEDHPGAPGRASGFLAL